MSKRSRLVPTLAPPDDPSPTPDRPLLMLALVGTFVVGPLFGVLGLLLVLLSDAGTQFHITVAGYDIEIHNIGIAAIFIGALVIIVNVSRVLKSVDRRPRS